MTAIQDVPLKTITGSDAKLGDYAGKVLLVVNVASKCGLTPQYEALEKLYKERRDQGLVVLGFPANDFGAQEPGTEKEIADFCDRTYAVRFPMMGKTAVKNEGGSAVFDGLAKATGERPKWNFHKYLISRDGQTVMSFASNVEPHSPELVGKIEEMLGK